MSGPKRTEIKPGSSVDERKQNALDMFKALAGRDPTPEEIKELEEAASKRSESSVDAN